MRWTQKWKYLYYLIPYYDTWLTVKYQRHIVGNHQVKIKFTLCFLLQFDSAKDKAFILHVYEVQQRRSSPFLFFSCGCITLKLFISTKHCITGLSIITEFFKQNEIWVKPFLSVLNHLDYRKYYIFFLEKIFVQIEGNGD